MRTVFSFIFILIFSLAMVSCLSRKPSPPVTIEKTKTVKEIVKDTVYEVSADSSFYYAYVECVNGKPVLKEPTKYKDLPKNKAGKALHVPTAKINGNVLTVGCYQEAQRLFKQWRETYISENEKKEVPVYVEKPFKWYHKVLMWIGGIFLVLSAIGLVLKFTIKS